MDTCIFTHTLTGSSTWQHTLSQRTSVCIHTYPCTSSCVDEVASSQAGFLADVSDSFGALVQSSGGKRARERRMLSTAPLCTAHAYPTLTFLSTIYAITSTYICMNIHTQKKRVIVSSVHLLSFPPTLSS